MSWYLFARNYQEPFDHTFFGPLQTFEEAYDRLVNFYEQDFVMIVQMEHNYDARSFCNRQYQYTLFKLEESRCSF